MIMAVILIVVSSFLIHKILSPLTKETQVDKYYYSMSVASDYKVYLIENDLFEENFLEEDMVYSRNIFDKLNIDFYAELTGLSPIDANIMADYKIEVRLISYQVKQDINKIIYEKTFPILEKSQVNFTNKASIFESVSLNFSEYENYVNSAESILMADPFKEAEIFFTGNFILETPYGEKEEDFSYSIPLPFFEELFTIDKPSPIEKNATISVLDKETIYLEQSLLAIPGLLILAMLVLVIYLLYKTQTKSPSKEEILQGIFKSIIRKYGSRIAKVNKSISIKYESKLIISDMESMVKISDQYNIPIFYVLGKDGIPKDNSLFIPKDNICYIYYLG